MKKPLNDGVWAIADAFKLDPYTDHQQFYSTVEHILGYVNGTVLMSKVDDAMLCKKYDLSVDGVMKYISTAYTMQATKADKKVSNKLKPVIEYITYLTASIYIGTYNDSHKTSASLSISLCEWLIGHLHKFDALVSSILEAPTDGIPTSKAFIDVLIDPDISEYESEYESYYRMVSNVIINSPNFQHPPGGMISEINAICKVMMDYRIKEAWDSRESESKESVGLNAKRRYLIALDEIDASFKSQAPTMVSLGMKGMMDVIIDDKHYSSADEITIFIIRQSGCISRLLDILRSANVDDYETKRRQVSSKYEGRIHAMAKHIIKFTESMLGEFGSDFDIAKGNHLCKE